MKIDLWKKGLVLGIIVLFVGAGVTISISGTIVENIFNHPILKGKTLYVGGSGEGNYTSIQDAIDNASDGDTVFVYDDSSPYYEYVIINKTINLIGENRNATIIDSSDIYPSSSAIRIKSNYCNISNFTLTGGPGGTHDSGIFIKSNFNHIQECNLINSQGSGISLWGSYNLINNNLIARNNDYGIWTVKNTEIINNMISDNNISFNGLDGIYFGGSANHINNKIYHNKFIDNNRNNANDCWNNTWDNGYPSGGNYWDDYIGEDKDGDGIGDSPYPIPGGDNEDRYPLMEPWGGNKPPTAPTINGQTSGNTGTSYPYLFNSTDPDGDDVRYFIDWGDNTSEWTGYNPSGTDVTVNHNWSNDGTYNITAKAQDIYGLESPEGKLTVTMPRNKPSNYKFNLLEWFFKRFPNLFPILRQLLRLG